MANVVCRAHVHFDTTQSNPNRPRTIYVQTNGSTCKFQACNWLAKHKRACSVRMPSATRRRPQTSSSQHTTAERRKTRTHAQCAHAISDPAPSNTFLSAHNGRAAQNPNTCTVRMPSATARPRAPKSDRSPKQTLVDSTRPTSTRQTLLPSSEMHSTYDVHRTWY